MIANLGLSLRRILAVVRRRRVIPLIAATGEGIQHLVEYRLGMFTPGDGLAPGVETDIRLAFGGLKAAAVIAAIVGTVRFLSAHQPAMARSVPDNPERLALLAALAGPLYAAHYGLNHLAYGAAPAATVTLLVLDSTLIGLLAVAIGSIVSLGTRRLAA